MNDEARRTAWRVAVIGTVLTALFVVAVGLAGHVVTATENQESVISELRSDAHDAIVREDLDVVIDSQFGLYDIIIDQYTSPECAIYADVGLTVSVLEAQLAFFPESIGLESLQSAAAEFIQTTKFDCEVAL